jgi:hypothetical protein
MLMSNKAVVLAIFKDEVAADTAATALKDPGAAHLGPVSGAKFVADKLSELGGEAEIHEVSDAALEEAHTAATTAS